MKGTMRLDQAVLLFGEMKLDVVWSREERKGVCTYGEESGYVYKEIVMMNERLVRFNLTFASLIL